MAEREITREGVLKAIEEFDELGRNAFLGRYGYGPSKGYDLVHESRRYDSKAIAGVAYKWTPGSGGRALAHDQLFGGRADAVKRLEALGFVVEYPSQKELWTREEHVLALDLYMTNPASPPGKTSSQVRELSALLNRLGEQRGAVRGDTYRNAAGVYMKMMNFRRLDPRFQAEGKVGLSQGSKGEEVVWREFDGRMDALRAEAARIRADILADAAPNSNASVAPAVEPGGAEATLISSFGDFRRVFVTAFHEFAPEKEGYLGFSAEHYRRWFLKQWRPGDLVLVYGTKGTQTAREARGQALGFLEIEPRPIRDLERVPRGYSRTDGQWPYAVPVLRAWRVEAPISIGDIAPATLRPGAPFQLIAARGQLLADEEAARALALPVRRAEVFGVATPADIRPEDAAFTPSLGLTPTFGQRTAEYADGLNYLYVLRLDGELLPALMNRPPYELRGKAVVKVGYSKDPRQRLKAHNGTLPPAARVAWRLEMKSDAFPSAEAAKGAEDRLKAHFKTRFQSLGNEFFLCEERSVASEFFAVARHAPAQSTPT